MEPFLSDIEAQKPESSSFEQHFLKNLQTFAVFKENGIYIVYMMYECMKCMSVWLYGVYAFMRSVP